MAKEEIANVKAKSLLQLVEKLGRDMSGFSHTLMGSQRDMLLLLGEMIQKEVIAAVTGPFGIMVDDMTDIANLEQMFSGPFVPLLRKKFSTARVAYSANHTAFN